MIDLNILTANLVYDNISMISNSMGLNTLDSIIHYCDKNDLDIETVATFVAKNMNMVAALQNEGEELRLLPKTAKLPL